MSATLLPTLPAEGDVYDPDGPTPEFRYEVIDGRIVRKPMGFEEVRLASIIHELLAPVVRTSGAGECYVDAGFVIPGGRNRKPDVSILRFDRWPRGRRYPKGDYLPCAPDMAVEVISPNDLSVEVARKLSEYLAGGVQVVWLVYPDLAQIHVFTPPGDGRLLFHADTLTADPVVPGFALPLADLFPPADPLPG